MIQLYETFLSKQEELLGLFLDHLSLTLMAVICAILIGIPVGILLTKNKRLASTVIGFANLVQAIPSLAILGFLIPIVGIGETPAIIMVVVYSLLPIIKNTYIGLSNIDPKILESSKGIGMTSFQSLGMVKLPLAMPVIMAGIRISAVTAVGLMTIAAFAGAGGLGDMVFTGIQTLNTNLILLGAIPAAILALVIDFTLGRFERIFTPLGLDPNLQAVSPLKKKLTFAVAFILCLAVLLMPMADKIAAMNKDENTITIGSKNYTEQLILGNMVAILIEENTDIEVKRALNLGGTQVVFEAIKAGDVDGYMEYTGTALVNMLKEPIITDMNEVYEKVKQPFKTDYGLEVLESFNINNTYTLSVDSSLQQKYDLHTISDLATYAPKLKLGSSMEFTNREDGLLGIEKAYNLKFKDVKKMDGSLRYQALELGEVDVVDAFATDGLIKKLNLTVLEDDLSVFPPYYAIPVFRQEVIESHPELGPLIKKLGSKLNNEEMMNLNYEVDLMSRSPEDVARSFLIEQELIQP